MTENNSPTESVEVAPFDLMRKDLQREHLIRAHGVYPESRDTKTDMETKHQKRHELEAQGQRLGRHVPHTHSAVVQTPLTDEQEAMVGSAKAGERLTDKPLSVSERRVLERLVDNDFATLRAEMQQFANDEKANRLAAVDAEWAERVNEAKRYEERVSRTIREAQAQLAGLVTEAGGKGIDLTIPEIERYGSTKAAVRGLADERSRVAGEVDRDLQRAMLTLKRQRLTAQRTILMNGVTPEAAGLLDGIPTAQALMVEAARANTQTAVEA